MYALAEPMPDPNESHSLPHLVIDVAATTLLYERCSRCMYLYSHGALTTPPLEEPVFDVVGDYMQAAQASHRWIELNVGPRFRLISHRGTVISAPVEF